MPNNSIIKESDENCYQLLNELVNERFYIIMFVTGEGPERSTVFQKASKLLEMTPNFYAIWLPHLTPGLMHFLENNVRDFNKISPSINNVVAFTISMAQNNLVHVINSGDWNATDNVRIFQAYNACLMPY